MSGVLLAFVGGLLTSIIASELLGWCPAIARWIVQRASAALPRESRARYIDEWNAEIDFLESRSRRAYSVVWALIVSAGAMRTGRVLRIEAPEDRQGGLLSGLIQKIAWSAYEATVLGALIVLLPAKIARHGVQAWTTVVGRLRGRQAGISLPRGVRPLWLHALSVREISVVAQIVRGFPDTQPLLLTTTSPVGHEHAQRVLGKRAAIDYLPFEVSVLAERFLDRYQPRALVLVSGDYWPLLLRAVKHRKLPVVVIDGKLSDHTFRRAQRLKKLFAPLFGPVDRFGVRNMAVARKLGELGVDSSRVTITGDLSYSTWECQALPVLQQLGNLAGDRPVLIAGSTMESEEEKTLEAFEQIGGGRRAFLILAPRHPERFSTVARLVELSGMTLILRSALNGSLETNELSHEAQRPDVLLLDSLGELSSVYRIATGAFIGGSLIPAGGHNPLDAVRWGVPVAVGPSMENFRELAGDFDRAGAWARVASAEELATVWDNWIGDPKAGRSFGERGKRLVESHESALSRTSDFLAHLLAETSSC